jgi:CheY-like chemotaxis protein
MRPAALVLCQEAPSLAILRTALENFEFDVAICNSQEKALQLLLQGSYVALIVDLTLPGAHDVAKLASLLVPPQKPVLLTMVPAWDGSSQAFQSGANLILYKPLELAQVKDSIAASRRLMRSESRRSTRHKMKALVYLELDTGTLPALGVDVSEHGLAVQAAEPLPLRTSLPFRFVLPGTHDTVHGRADVIWTDEKGRAGMFFSRLAPSARKHLKHWLSKRSVNTRDAVRVLLAPMNAPADAVLMK